MPEVRLLRVPGLEPPPGQSREATRKATHEDYTLKMILDSPLTALIDRAGAAFGFKSVHVAGLIEPELLCADDFFRERLGGERVDFAPILRQLISSELDADRMDYLRRDSLHAGVSYGQFDFDHWLVGNLSFEIQGGRCYLALQHRALYSFEDFLISRFHMFLMVYFHYKSVVFDAMLAQYFASPGCDYTLPADIEKFRDANDAQLYAHLAASPDEWARRITEKRPYRMLMELHSGIPAGKTAAIEQERLMEKTKLDLTRQGIHFLVGTSTGELSKYFHKPADPIFVRYDNHYSAPSSIPVRAVHGSFREIPRKT